MPRPLTNSDLELDAFDSICARLGGFNPDISFEWADGYLTALAAGRRVVPIEEWLPAMCGDAFERAFADPPDVALALAALSTRARTLAAQLDPERLLDFPDDMHLQPLMSEWNDETRQQALDEGVVDEQDLPELQSGAVWAIGFLQATEDFEVDWRDPPDADQASLKNDLLAQVSALVLPAGDELVAHVEKWHKGRDPSRETLIDDACFAIQDMRVFWLDHGPKPETRRVGATPGRNDPCPCGSGKKFKKCHGA